MKTTKTNLLLGTLLSGAMLSVAVPSFAQDTSVDDEVIVTGSRIQNNPNMELSSPVSTVDSAEFGISQTNVAEELLRELPSTIPSIGSAVNNGNGGSSFVNLRGIGSNRNLVLLDGRRFVPADTTGRVDLNSIPLAVLERSDILTGGATTTYGADAISGVVNFVTKRDFEGAELTLSQQLTEQGDGEVQRADLTVGANFDDGRGNATLSIGYQSQDAVFQGDRDYSEFNVSSFSGNPGGSSNSVPSNIIFNGPDGSVIGQINDQGTDIVGFNATPFNFNPFNIFQTPFERYNLYSSANYEVNDWLEVYAQGVFSKQTVSTIIAPGGSFFNTYQLNLNNPFIPTAIADRFCTAQGLDAAACTAATTTPFGATLADGSVNPDYVEISTGLRRRTVEAGTRNSDFTSTLFNLAAGARGDITSNVAYDVSVTYGESERIQRQSGFARFSRLQQAMLSLPDGSCSDPSGDCVAIDLFGPEGSITQDMIDYSFGLTQQVITSPSILTLNGTLSGELGFGLGGLGKMFSSTPIAFAAGGEYRKFTATRLSDEASQTPGAVVGGGGAAPDINGEYSVKDAFVELSVPVLEDQLYAQNLTLDLGARISDYSTAGTSLTYKAGGTWRYSDEVGFRGNYQKSSRAPNIGELFTPVTVGLNNLQTDPCQLALPSGNANLTAVCIAQGAPASVVAAGTIQPPAAGQINQTTGGNIDLGTEDANTFTIGAIWEPEFIPNLAVTLDYYNIKVTGAITAPAVGDIINGCFGNITAASASDPACVDLIFRNPTTGGLDGSPDETRGLIRQSSNLGTIETDGVDLSIDYGHELSSKLYLTTSFDGTYTIANKFQSGPGAVNRECVGYFSVNCGSPQSEITFINRTSLRYLEDYLFSVRWRYLSGLEQEPLDIESQGGAFQGESPVFGTVDFQQIPAEHYFDVSFQWDVTDYAKFTLTANNVLDNQPAIVGSNIGSTAFNSGNIYPSSYDALGRRYKASVTFKF